MVRAEAAAKPLRRHVAEAAAERSFFDRGEKFRVGALAGGSSLGGRLGELAGRSVLVATSTQLAAALALIELDGLARRVTVLPADTEARHLDAVLAAAEVDAIVCDDGARLRGFQVPIRVLCGPSIVPLGHAPSPSVQTEWVLLTSGTTGVPKLVAHSLAALTAPIALRTANDPMVWATFYDIRRYGGLQIFLRAVVGATSLVLSSSGEPVGEHLARLAQHGVTHLSGTPSHWRRALMSPAIRSIAPRYVRLSGEIADQTVLDSLRAVFPQASIGHAFASTEAGVVFDVNDGLAGFPASFVDGARDGVEMKIVDDSLRIRSPRTASRYLGPASAALADADGFVDTGDMIERCGDRYFFTGRRGGIINVGGQKVHPEEIEAVINKHSQVRMSLVRPKKNPIMGSIAIADVVLKSAPADEVQIRADILKLCREMLPRHKVPAAISFVPSLHVAATGKLARQQG